ncbi:ImmA/IrrE family metallo-endopeptidase [Bacillus altitudinis]|uniref:ImmA/IrrE family metallo-endopeptidase n=1 Tax=Bacillus altitudinis TaxID=293387 RepID=UPI00398B60EE
MKVEFLNISSRYYAGTIIIDNRLSPQEQWQNFGHELCHALRHEGNQLIMPHCLESCRKCRRSVLHISFVF